MSGLGIDRGYPYLVEDTERQEDTEDDPETIHANQADRCAKSQSPLSDHRGGVLVLNEGVESC